MPVALVTGANRGIGLEVARQLAARGVSTFASSRRGEPNAHGDALALDVTSDASVRGAAAKVRASGEPLDVLVNNAAVLLDENEPILELDVERFRETLEANVTGALRVTQAFWPLLRDGATVVNVSSGAGLLDGMDDWAPAYAVSKTALNALTIQLAIAGRERKIRVNAVCPGWVRTRMGGRGAPRSVEQGADGIVWLTLDAPKNLTGRFVRDRKVVPW